MVLYLLHSELELTQLVDESELLRKVPRSELCTSMPMHPASETSMDLPYSIFSQVSRWPLQSGS